MRCFLGDKLSSSHFIQAQRNKEILFLRGMAVPRGNHR
jgi:hypothetical protein